MRLLLDTQAFLWWDDSPERLSAAAQAAIKDPANELLLSVVSVWEMAIKMQLGKLRLTTPLAERISSQQARNQFAVLPVELRHTLQLTELPLHHKDPFDRLLVAQAQVEGAALVSGDAALRHYAVTILW